MRSHRREANIELVIGEGDVPLGVRAHLKLDTGMGRYGVAGLSEVPPEVVGVIGHLATADVDATFAEQQIARFAEATRELTHLDRHIANSAAALRYPSARFDAARCGIALYGLSPFGTDPAEDGLEPVLHWQSHLAQVKQLAPGQSTGYGRRFIAERPTWIGIVPVGYADGFRRDLTGTQVRVGGDLCRVVGTVSMDSFAVELERAAGRHAGRPRRSRRSPRRPRAPCGHDRLRARVEDREWAKPGTQNRGGRLMETLDLVEELQQARAAELSERVRVFVQPRGDERALDVGSGLGALALALAPHVREVVGGRAATGARRARPQGGRRGRQRRARRRGRAGAALRARVLRPQRHAPHAAPRPRPELVVAELARVTRPGGIVLVVDQLAPGDPLAAVDLDRFERARDPSHTRLLADVDLRGLFDANRLVLIRSRVDEEVRDLDRYLDLAGCHGPARDDAAALAPGDKLSVEVGWYLLRRD